ncbi:hypothetical protein [Desertivirga brevis]|uniref:hypothetical protein n=1 Tax=Desertivirga brevis TaxID=2810310 RepID=UPI001A96A0D4|nr:hypothetical protein [Pedobacter sp. SYSU D00873]
MIAILTGDIINSRKATSTEEWLSVLKEALGSKESWEIFRGDSFQLKTEVEEALLKAIYIKACVKTIKNIDVRIAIGIGREGYTAEKLSESNGEAFIFSGEKFELLKKEKVSLSVRSASADFDFEFNIALKLALIAVDKWTPAVAEMVKIALENQGASQSELAELTNKTQSSVSEALSRANFFEILELNSLYKKKIKNLSSIDEPASN